MSGTAFGTYLRNQRVKAGLSLRSVAKALGVSAVYLGEVERGLSAPLARDRWDHLLTIVPTLSRDGLERHAAKVTSLQLDLTDAPVQYQNIGYALARRLEKRDLSDDDRGQLLELLGRWGEEKSGDE